MGNGWVLALAAAVAVAGVVEIVAGRTLWGLVRGARAQPVSRDRRVARRSGAHLLLVAVYGVAFAIVARTPGVEWTLLVMAVFFAGVFLLRRAMPMPPEYRWAHWPFTVARPPEDPGAVYRRHPAPPRGSP